MRLDLADEEHRGDTVEKRPAYPISDLMDGTHRESDRWVDFCTDCNTVID